MAGEAWWTADEVARHLRVSRMTVYRWAKSGKLPVYRIGRLRRYRPHDVEALAFPETALAHARPLNAEALAAMQALREDMQRRLGPGVLTEDSVEIKRRMREEQERKAARHASS